MLSDTKEKEIYNTTHKEVRIQFKPKNYYIAHYMPKAFMGKKSRNDVQGCDQQPRQNIDFTTPPFRPRKCLRFADLLHQTCLLNNYK